VNTTCNLRLVLIYLQQVNDSSVIMSVLESYLFDKTVPLDKLLTYYPAIEKKTGGRFISRTVQDFPNRNFLMFQEHISDKRTPEDRA
jgi:microsomal prostaglandin-E synthase 2